MQLIEAIEKINFEEIKNNYKTVKIKVINEKDYGVESIEIEYQDAPTIYDKEGYTYCINTKHMPFRFWPMRSNNYIQTYKSVKRMLNSLYKNINSKTEVQI